MKTMGPIGGCALLSLFAVWVGTAEATPPPSVSTLGSEVVGDLEYLTDNIQLDLEDIATSPLHVADPDSPLSSARFYLALAGAGALWGTSFALDQTLQTRVGHMAHSAHDVMENLSYVSLISAAGLLYAYGLYGEDERARHCPLTGTEAGGMGVLFNLAIEAMFGRLRPFQTGSHTAFFHKVGAFNAGSFTSEDMVLTSAMATGVSEYFDNKWYVAVPLYSLVLTEGFTRIGSGQNWFSDVVAGGLLGWGTAEMLLWLHERHAMEPNRWRILPMPQPTPVHGKVSSMPSVGLCVAYLW